MDFTLAFPHSNAEALAFSPGSTFFALVARDPSSSSAESADARSKRRRVSDEEAQQARRSTVIIRASSTLQVVRSWELDGNITSLQWSPEGRFLLAVVSGGSGSATGSESAAPASATSNGVVYVLSLDPSAEANDGSDEYRGWVARIDAGLEGLAGAQWMVPPTDTERGHKSSTVILFSQHDLRATVYDLATLRATIITDVRSSSSASSSSAMSVPALVTTPSYPSHFGLLRRTACKDTFTIYRASVKKPRSASAADGARGSYLALLHGDPDHPGASRSGSQQQEQQLFAPEQSFPVALHHARGVAWSPNGRYLALWEAGMEYKLVVYTRCGTLRYTFWIPPQSQSQSSSSMAGAGDALQPVSTAVTGEAFAADAELAEKEERERKVLGSISANKRSDAADSPVTSEGNNDNSASSSSGADNKPPLRRSRARNPSAAERRKVSGEKDDGVGASSKVFGDGLGIRQVQWSPDSKILAVGGYDEKVRLLDADSGSELSVLDLSRSVINGELSHNRLPVLQAYKPRADLVFGRLQVWREPNLAWIAATAKRSIVALDCATRSLPLTIPCTRVDMAQAQPKCGICWLAWSKSGMFLASRNENMPNAVFVHALPPVPADRDDQTPRPYLTAVLLFASPVRSVAWHPQDACSLTIACGGQAVYTWSLALAEDGESIVQTAEGVPIPSDHINANSLQWSPDGNTLLLADRQSFCCAITG